MPGGLKEFLPWIFAWEAHYVSYVSCQKKNFENKIWL